MIGNSTWCCIVLNQIKSNHPTNGHVFFSFKFKKLVNFHYQPTNERTNERRSTDSAFVGHIHDGKYTPETYLAAAVLSDMVLNICITPPLAFNQVLNSLVSQAMGSNNPKMAGIWLQQSMFWLSVSMLPCLTGLFYVEPILTVLGFPSDIAKVAGVYAKYNIIWPIPNGTY